MDTIDRDTVVDMLNDSKVFTIDCMPKPIRVALGNNEGPMIVDWDKVQEFIYEQEEK